MATRTRPLLELVAGAARGKRGLFPVSQLGQSPAADLAFIGGFAWALNAFWGDLGQLPGLFP